MLKKEDYSNILFNYDFLMMEIKRESINNTNFVSPNTIIAEQNFKYTKYTGAEAYYA